MVAQTKSWTALDVLTPGPSGEAIEYGLMEAGALGTQTTSAGKNCLNVRGYFATAPDIDSVRAALIQALTIHEQFTSSTLTLKVTEIEDCDWLAEWKKSWRPVQVGRFIIAPPWIESASLASANQSIEPPFIIRINPGMAFGTGTHETTRLCLKAIEKYFAGGSFLDVGTGTGILAIAAAKMFQKADCEGGPPRITACDTDAEAITIAKDNAKFNEVADRINFHVGTITNETSSADLVCANLTAPVIVALLPSLLGATCERLVLSGILDSQIEMVKSRLLELAVLDFEFDQDGEWVALTI
ncbi:MAG: 50S ribosomal protein L11 methyltransferase [Pyrinomonadaceae bacterium]